MKYAVPAAEKNRQSLPLYIRRYHKSNLLQPYTGNHLIRELKIAIKLFKSSKFILFWTKGKRLKRYLLNACSGTCPWQIARRVEVSFFCFALGSSLLIREVEELRTACKGLKNLDADNRAVFLKWKEHRRLRWVHSDCSIRRCRFWLGLKKERVCDSRRSWGAAIEEAIVDCFSAHAQ